MIQNSQPNFKAGYLGDGTLRDPAKTVLSDLHYIINTLNTVGLKLNTDNRELYIPNSNSRQRYGHSKNLTPNIRVTDESNLCLLGAPVFVD